MSTEQRQSAPSSAARVWKFRCADCGTSWDVTALMILESNDWTRCPNCDTEALRDHDQVPANDD
jgi:DNA-directed RNA polymerase subunit RPC12/RpoP